MKIRFWSFISLIPAYIIAKSIDGIGGFWDNSFLFISLVIFFAFIKIRIRLSEKSWISEGEWIFIPIYLLIIPALWWWLKLSPIIFIFTFSVLFSSWLIYIQNMLSNKRSSGESN